ncbi:MAG: hypothetical protein R3F44_00155 [Candidatus Competibacteraceae bacterium]
MNKALTFRNWRSGGKHYVLNATSSNKWTGFQESVIDKLKKKFGDDFISQFGQIVTRKMIFIISPFYKLKHLFTDEHKTTGNFTNRWTLSLMMDFLMHANSSLA